MSASGPSGPLVDISETNKILTDPLTVSRHIVFKRARVRMSVCLENRSRFLRESSYVSKITKLLHLNFI